MRRYLTPALALAAICLAFTTTGAQDPADAMAERKKAISGFLDRIDESASLRWNARQMHDYSYFQGDDVVPRLLAIYQRPPTEFSEHMPYLAAAMVRRRLDLPEDVRFAHTRFEASESDIKELRKFLKVYHRRQDHLWGVYCAGCILALQRDPDLNMELLELVGNKRVPAVNRAALLDALSRSGADYIRRALEVMVLRKWKAKGEDAVLLEAIAWAAARVYRPLHEENKAVPDDWRLVMDEIAALVDDEKDTLPRTRREAALALQHAFGTKHPYLHSAMWKLLFDNGIDPHKDDGHSVARFMGLDVLGQRILFVIDASDSMLNPLSDEERESVKGPITGDKRGGKDAYEIDWSRVRNRFDAAREHVKWTISRLESDKQVAVILFGDDVERLASTPGFITTSTTNVRRINATLDAIRPSEAEPAMKERRPYGVLMGETNYYGALQTAYRLGRTGLLNSPREHWDLKLVEEGADSIFLLSDGAPNRDGFSGRTPKIEYEYKTWSYHDSKQPGEGEWVEFPARPAQPEREVETRDPETGAIIKRKIPAQPARPATRRWRKPTVVSGAYDNNDSNGPYVSVSSFAFVGGFEINNLLDEVERMNVVRRVRIHCIGIGEAEMGWLLPIARKGRGKAVYFGKDGMKEAGDEEEVPDLPDGFPRPGVD